MSEAPATADRAVQGGIRQEYEVPVGYKRTEVGVLPEDWQVVTIRSVANIVRGAGAAGYGHSSHNRRSSAQGQAVPATRDASFLQAVHPFIAEKASPWLP